MIAASYWNKDRHWSYVILTVTLLHFLFGKYGWFGRYEIYYLVFIFLIGARHIMAIPRKIVPGLLLLPFAFPSLAYSTAATPLAASNIFNQQAQMARMARLLGEPVAVNDLGLVALKSGQYVLDLWGLGSIEALHYRTASRNSEWISTLMQKRHVKYAFIYDSWFPSKPPEWIKVAELELLQKRITPASSSVSLYATDSISAEKMRSVLVDFAHGNNSKEFSVKVY